MLKTLVYLEEGQLRALRHLSRQKGWPVARFLREAVSRYLQHQETGRPLANIIGIGAGPKTGDVSGRSDDLLKRVFARSPHDPRR